MHVPTHKTNDSQKSRSFRWLEGMLLIVVLCIAVIRLSFIEMPHNNMQNALLLTTPRGVSLLLSGALFIAIMLGLLIQVLQARWKPGGVMITGWILFALGAAVSAYLAASDKRAAMTEGFTLIVPMFAAMVLCGWLDSSRRVSVVLWVILSMGCTAVYASLDQYFESNQKMVEDYQQNPQRHLQILGIEPNSLAQFQYEHRLHSKDIRGLLTTSNSTGTFLLAGVFVAAGLLVDILRNRNQNAGFAANLAVLAGIFLVLLAGLFIVKSRGAIAAFALSAVLFIGLAVFGRLFWQHRRLILLLFLLAFIGVWIAAITYGINHGRLPGPNALHVRWQYWVSSARMAAEHPLGIGGGNFGTFFVHYKIPAAPEAVRDPHNLVLSVLCQFGPLGLLGFASMVFAALWKGLKQIFEKSSAEEWLNKQDKIVSFGVLICVLAALLWIRPFVSEGGILGENTIVRQSVFIIMYLIPAFFFVCPFVFLWTTGKEMINGNYQQGLTTGLICAVVGLLFHNLIDFALFEPGNWMILWILIALITSVQISPRPPLLPSKMLKILWPVVFLAITGIALYLYVWVPVRAGMYFQAGLRNYDNPKRYFHQAAQIDPLDPDPWLYTAKWTEFQFTSLQAKDSVANTTQAEKYLTDTLMLLQQARQRDSDNFIYSESLSRIYVYLSEVQKENRQKHLDSAFEAELEALRLYPGSDRITYELGILAEKMNQPQKAIEYFSRAAAIEDQYRRQFAEMYPGYPLCSRLGQSRYEYAKNYILKSHSSQ